MIASLFGTWAARANWLIGLMCAAWLMALSWASVPKNDLLAALGDPAIAAWVQAIGSIAAIIAAVIIAQRQSEAGRALMREQAHRAKMERLEPVRALIDGAAELASGAQPNFGWLEEIWDVTLFTELEAELGQVSLIELGDFEITRGVLNFRRAFSSLRYTMGVLHGRFEEDMHNQGPPVDEEDRDWFTVRQLEVANVHVALSERLRDLASQGYVPKAASIQR